MSRGFLIALSALALTGAAPPQAAAPAGRAPLPVEAFAEIPQIEEPEISPDGKQIAGKIAIRGKQYFAVLTPGVEGLPKLLNPGKADLNWWSWVNDEWLVVGIGQEVPVAGDT